MKSFLSGASFFRQQQAPTCLKSRTCAIIYLALENKHVVRFCRLAYHAVWLRPFIRPSFPAWCPALLHCVCWAFYVPFYINLLVCFLLGLAGGGGGGGAAAAAAAVTCSCLGATLSWACRYDTMPVDERSFVGAFVIANLDGHDTEHHAHAHACNAVPYHALI